MEKVEILRSYSIFKSKFFLFLLIISNLCASSLIEKGDNEFVKKNYKMALEYYLKSDKKGTLEVKLRIIQSYLKMGDNYTQIRSYKMALYWYNQAKKLNSRESLKKIAIVYEKQADRYYSIHKYKKALELYFQAKHLKNKNVIEKIKNIKFLLSHQKKLDNDTRIIVTKNSPSWTHSIGRLIIPTKLNIQDNKRYSMKIKRCSATLISLNKYKDSHTIITASHCLSNYSKKAGHIKFIIKDSKNNILHRIAKVKYDSKFDHQNITKTTDLAILTLDEPISQKQIKPLIIKKYSFYDLQKKYKNSFGSLGGFSNDIAKFGTKLTYDPKCKLKKHSNTFATSNCKGFKGASGGPIILTTTNDNKNFNYHFVGVISHFKNNNYANIFFSPHHKYYDNIKKIIRTTAF